MRATKSNSLIILLLTLHLFLNLAGQIRAQNKSSAKARIIQNSYSVNEDSVIQLGLLIELEKDWHIYWKNSGDSGIPTSIEWNVPQNFQLTQKQWSIPRAFEFDGLVSYGYDNQVLFIAEVKIPANTHKDVVNLSVKIESLICKDICIPFDTLISFQLDLRKSFVPDDDIIGLFTKTINELPVPLNSNLLTARINSDKVYLRIDNLSNINFDDGNVFFLSYENGLFANTMKQLVQKGEGYSELVIEADQFRTKEPEELYGLLIHSSDQSGNNKSKAYEIKIPIT